VPATAHLGNEIGWRAGSVTIASVAAVVALAVLLLVPALPARPGWRDQESGSLPTAVRRSWLVLLVTALVAVGQFSAFTFVGPILESVSGVGESDLPRVLLAYGVAGMAGNVLAGRFVGRNPRRGIQLIAATITVTLFVLLTVDVGPMSTTGLMVVWGLAFGGSSVTLQLWLLQVAGRAGQLATSASVSVFNVAIAVGSAVGGVAIDVTGMASSALVVAVVVLLAAALTAVLSRPRVIEEDVGTHA
jgi:predicted MFS family arabinose efflux permease